jgi:hypothetical protein
VATELALPRIFKSEAVPGGKVVVIKVEAGRPVSQLAPGEPVVLRGSDGTELELFTAAGPLNVRSDGTYLNSQEADAFGAGELEGATLRPYGRGDSWRKARSWPGRLALAGALVTLLVAIVSFAYAAFGQSPPTAASTAAQVERALEASVPSELLIRCMDRIQDPGAPDADVPGVRCSADKPSFWTDKNNAPLLVGVLSLLAAVLGGIAVWLRFGFQQEP